MANTVVNSQSLLQSCNLESLCAQALGDTVGTLYEPSYRILVALQRHSSHLILRMNRAFLCGRLYAQRLSILHM